MTVRVIDAEAVCKVPLALKTLAPEGGKVFNIVNIVKGVPVGVEPELTGVESLHDIAFRLGHGAEAAGNASCLSIVDDSVQYGLYITFAQRKGIDTGAVKLGKQYQKAV
jgi:hypothetical protein